MSEITTERAIAVLEALRHPITNAINLVNVEVEDIQQALDKAIEVMKDSCENCINQHRGFEPNHNFIDNEELQ